MSEDDVKLEEEVKQAVEGKGEREKEVPVKLEAAEHYIKDESEHKGNSSAEALDQDQDQDKDKNKEEPMKAEHEDPGIAGKPDQNKGGMLEAFEMVAPSEIVLPEEKAGKLGSEADLDAEPLDEPNPKQKEQQEHEENGDRDREEAKLGPVAMSEMVKAERPHINEMLIKSEIVKEEKLENLEELKRKELNRVRKKQWNAFEDAFMQNVNWDSENRPKLYASRRIFEHLCRKLLATLDQVAEASAHTVQYYVDSQKHIRPFLMSMKRSLEVKKPPLISITVASCESDDTKLCFNLSNFMQYLQEILVPEIRKVHDDIKAFVALHKSQIETVFWGIHEIEKTSWTYLQKYVAAFNAAENEVVGGVDPGHKLWVCQRAYHKKITQYKVRLGEACQLFRNFWGNVQEFCVTNAELENNLYEKFVAERRKMFVPAEKPVDAPGIKERNEELFGMAALFQEGEMLMLSRHDAAEGQSPRFPREELDKYDRSQLLDFLKQLVDTVPSSPSSEFIKKQGLVLRKVGIVKKDYESHLMILSSNYCVHFFEKEWDAEPKASYRLSELKRYLHLDGDAGKVIVLELPGKGFLSFSTYEYIKVDDPDEYEAWKRELLL